MHRIKSIWIKCTAITRRIIRAFFCMCVRTHMCKTQVAFLLVLCVFLLSLSIRYLKLIFPLVLLLEVLSSCGQLLENEIWQGFRLEAAQDVAPPQSRSNYRTPVQESVFRSVMETVPETERRQWSHWRSSNHGAIAASQHHPLKARVCQRVS